ncbi:DegV family protein [Alkaliphilus serpentinus]|uniref:DegV family protein n=1 Tax=Alkaliphilus serpentinus TaxID=1482731 RepID=A0A833M7E7_9FIRM|nr:DegV family protein [Alkaliphilus serpentinus]KAB3530255.1 DegV family protein [Alkaliphilus serpentinus]
MIQIVTDSTAYFERAEMEKYGLKIVPLSVNFENTVSDEGFPGEFDEFFNRLAVSKDFPTTSQPSAGAFAEVYKKAIEEGKEVITITLTAKLSGTYNSAITAAALVDQSKVTVVDSETTAANLKELVMMALELSNNGLSRNEIVNILESQKKRMGVNLTVGTLEYLKKGGRLSNTGALIGNLLNIKPIIALKDGKLVPVGKVRGRKNAIEKISEGIPQEVKTISICHIFALEEATEIKEYFIDKYPSATINLEVLGPVIGAHLGPKALGVLYSY